MRTRDIHDHTPPPLEFEPSAETANTIRPWLPDDVQRCRGELRERDGTVTVCPLRESCKRHVAPVNDAGHVVIWGDHLCTDTVSLQIPLETPHTRAIRETEDALREALL